MFQKKKISLKNLEENPEKKNLETMKFKCATM